jgi:hypothetical protein
MSLRLAAQRPSKASHTVDTSQGFPQPASSVSCPNFNRAIQFGVQPAVAVHAHAVGAAVVRGVAHVQVVIALPGRERTPQALAYAALGLAVGIALLWRWRLASGEGLDLTPSLHWPAHDGEDDPDHEQGPVLIVVEYLIDPARTGEFAEAMRPVRLNRLRDGAMRWGLFEDMTARGRWLETFLVESWVEHLREHERMRVADHAVEERARAFLVSHYIAHLPGR